jgi:hypothetical protein
VTTNSIPTQLDSDHHGLVTITVEKDGRIGGQEHFERHGR